MSSAAQGSASPVALSTARIEKARALLAQAKNVEDAFGLLTQAEAMQTYMHRQNAASEAHADSWEIVQHARRTLGTLSAALPKAAAGRKPKIGPPDGPIAKSAALAAIGVSKQDANRWEALAMMTVEEFEARIVLGRERILNQATGGELAATSSGAKYDGDTWGTPEEFIAAEREVLGGAIELDPASNAAANNIVRALRFYTREDSGLVVPWLAATVHLNPPYSDPLCAQFVAKFNAEYGVNFGAGFVLVNNATDTEWCQSLLARFPVCFPKGRIGFLYNGVPIKGNRQGQAIFYAGDKQKLFREVFSRFGAVMRP